MTYLIISDADVFDARSYDYLVVGGGTSGLALASRLAEDKEVSVGVLEAGDHHENNELIDIPGHFGSLVGNDDFDWKFETTPQQGLDGRVLPWPRGKVLGGTSALNFLVWNRGAKEDYDAWEELGNPGWNWTSLLLVLQFDDDVSVTECTPQLGPLSRSQRRCSFRRRLTRRSTILQLILSFMGNQVRYPHLFLRGTQPLIHSGMIRFKEL